MSQLERYITQKLGADFLSGGKSRTELRKIKTETADLERKLAGLRARRMEIEKDNPRLERKEIS